MKTSIIRHVFLAILVSLPAITFAQQTVLFNFWDFAVEVGNTRMMLQHPDHMQYGFITITEDPDYLERVELQDTTLLLMRKGSSPFDANITVHAPKGATVTGAYGARVLIYGGDHYTDDLGWDFYTSEPEPLQPTSIAVPEGAREEEGVIIHYMNKFKLTEPTLPKKAMKLDKTELTSRIERHLKEHPFQEPMAAADLVKRTKKKAPSMPYWNVELGVYYLTINYVDEAMLSETGGEEGNISKTLAFFLY